MLVLRPKIVILSALLVVGGVVVFKSTLSNKADGSHQENELSSDFDSSLVSPTESIFEIPVHVEDPTLANPLQVQYEAPPLRRTIRPPGNEGATEDINSLEYRTSAKNSLEIGIYSK